jgi:hypothetical protein
VGTRGSFPGGKSGRGVKLSTHLHLMAEVKECVELYLLHGVVLGLKKKKAKFFFM